MKLLVVEDEQKLNKALVQGLQQRGFAVDFALDGEEGKRLARLNGYDVILLDIMLPKKDGLTVCKNLRALRIATPVIFLTAKDQIIDKVEGLDMGADDYLVKPFSFDELNTRIRSILRGPHRDRTHCARVRTIGVSPSECWDRYFTTKCLGPCVGSVFRFIQ